MFGNKAQRISDLENQVENLINANERLITRNNELSSDIRMHRTNSELEINSIQNGYKIDLQSAVQRADRADFKFNERVDFAVAKKTRELDAAHLARMTKLEKEHAEKIAKCDHALETDKSTYRKYLRSEFNDMVSENTRLVKENFDLRGKNSGLEGSVKCMEGQVKTMADTMNQFVKVLPKIEANFTTPSVAPTVTLGSGNKVDSK